MSDRNKLTDEKIQQIVDPKNLSSEKAEIRLLSEDAELYSMLMENLNMEPSIAIPEKFALQTTTLAIRRKMIRDFLWNVVLFLSVSIPLITISLTVVYFMGQNMFWEFKNIIAQEIEYILFAAIGFITIQLIDKLLIQNKLEHLQNNH